jgi:hypothetical protein
LSDVTGLAWSTVDRLVIGGSGQCEHAGKSTVIEAYSDGLYEPLQSDRSPELTSGSSYEDTTIQQVESYPVSPLDPNGFSPVMVQTTPKGVVAGRAGPAAVASTQKSPPTYPFFADPDPAE